MQVAINGNIYSQAQMYAQERGQDLSAMIENFLRSYIERSHTATKQQVPDIVSGLIGVAKPAAADDDINGRAAYASYLEEKYR